jgi:hypothetical protein
VPSETLVADDLADALAYQRRKPEDTVLYRVVQHSLETFLASAREQGRVVPRFVERELRAFLDCLGLSSRAPPLAPAPPPEPTDLELGFEEPWPGDEPDDDG